MGFKKMRKECSSDANFKFADRFFSRTFDSYLALATVGFPLSPRPSGNAAGAGFQIRHPSDLCQRQRCGRSFRALLLLGGRPPNGARNVVRLAR